MIDYPQLLKEHDLKVTFQRIQILGVIEKFGHISIDSIYEEVSKVHSSLSLATIYKNIFMMVERGVLTEVPIIGKKSKYEITKDDHLHLICTKCGKVIDRDLDDEIDNDMLRAAKESGFVLDQRQLNLYGECKECRG